jgi:hypothetical protein
MKHVFRSSNEVFIYYWQPRKRGFIGIRVGLTHAWVIVGVESNPEELLVIGPGPSLPVQPENETAEFREVRQEVASQHPELEALLRGEISIDKASEHCAVARSSSFTAENGLPGFRAAPRSRGW